MQRCIFGTLSVFLWACSGENVIEKQENVAPTILIASHSDGVEVQDGYVENFRATVSDDDNQFSELSIAWYVGENIVCDWTEASPAGESFCEIAFAADDSNVIVEVRDPQGAGARDEISIVVLPTEAPEVEILNPIRDQSYYSDQLIQFSGMVSDLEDDASDLVVTWTSSVDGALSLDTSIDSSGMLSDYGYLTEGNHALELRAEDSSGKFSTAEVVIQVGGPNNTPTCALEFPTNNQVAVLGDAILFQGLAEDLDIANNDLQVELSSNIDGVFQNTVPFSDGSFFFGYDGLSAGLHTITLRVWDEIGAECSTGVLLRVGTPPTVNIDVPSNNEVIAVGESITFEGTVSDGEDPANQLTVVWSSSLDGELHTGVATSQGSSQFTESGLSAGVHSITLTATDSTDLSGDDVLSLRVNHRPVVDSIQFSPTPVYSNNNLTISTQFSDADGQSVTGTMIWFENGVQTSFTGNSINSSNLDVGDVWTVRVTPNDGFQDGNYLEESITVSNSDPVVSNGMITSSSSPNIYVDSVLTCSGTGSDIDGSVSLSYSWNINGASSTGATVDLQNFALAVGDSVECSITATDTDGGTASTTVNATIDNRSPIISNVSTAPIAPASDDIATCSAVYTDPDGDNMTVDYYWVANGTSIGSSNTLNIANTNLNSGDNLECQVTVTDSHGATAQASVVTVIADNAPVFDVGPVITPSAPVYVGDLLTCSATASDPDDGVSSLSYIWSVNGTQVSSGATWTINSNDAAVNDSITCTGIALDYSGNSTTAVSSPVVVSNTPPVMNSVVLNDVQPFTNDNIVVLTSSSDAEGDSITHSYEWHVIDASNGNTDTIVVSGTGAAFAGLAGVVSFDRDDEIYVIVTPNDGNANGASMESDHAIVQNSAPTAPVVSVTVSGNPPLEGVDDLTCSITGVSTDLDADALTYTYEWFDDNGNSMQLLSNSTALQNVAAAALTTAGTWTCEVTVSDGSLSASTLDTILVESDWDGALTFTNCGQTGRTGPSQSLCNSEYSTTLLSGQVTVNGGIQTWTVPSDGLYVIEAVGASGGDSVTQGFASGGAGALVSGEFQLFQGDQLQILVGQEGGGTTCGGGGGGGTFVVLNNSPLVIAGGGGAAMSCNYNQSVGGNGFDAVAGNTCGGNGGFNDCYNSNSASESGGCNGSGGNSGSYGGGGGGFLTNGESTSSSMQGSSYQVGGIGGSTTSGGSGPFGGFGGGGGSWDGCCGGAGGGGGYSGGASGNECTPAGGGGSINNGSNTLDISGYNTGHGYVIIDR